MIRLLHITATLVLLLALGLLVSCMQQWLRKGYPVDVLGGSPGAVQAFRESAARRRLNDGERASPLVQQAEALASYLVPAERAQKAEAAPVERVTPEPAPSIRPVAASAKFKLVGTSYYPNQPKRSMALISEPGSGASPERWVKEGAQVEHFIIHEIRHGVIVYRDGDNLREMAVQTGLDTPSLVHDTHPGSREMNGAGIRAGPVALVPAGPGGMEIADEN